MKITVTQNGKVTYDNAVAEIVIEASDILELIKTLAAEANKRSEERCAKEAEFESARRIAEAEQKSLDHQREVELMNKKIELEMARKSSNGHNGRS